MKHERTLGLASAVFLMIGFVIGGAIFILMPVINGITGPSLWLAYLLAGIPSVFGAFYVIQLIGVLPATASHFIGITKWISPAWGATFSFATVMAMTTGSCFVAWGAAQHLRSVFPNLPTVLVAALILAAFIVLNCLGTRIVSGVQNVLTLVLIAAILMYSFGGLRTMDASFQIPFMRNGTVNFFIAFAICTFAWSGITSIAELAGDIKNPRRNIPWAVVITILAIGTLYGFFAYVFTSNISAEAIDAAGQGAVFVAAERFLPGSLITVVYIAALIAMLTTLNGFVLMASREMMAMSKLNILPAWFGQVSKKKTPVNALVVFGLIAVVCTLFAATLNAYSSLMVFAVCYLMIMGALTTLRISQKSPDLYAKSKFRFPSAVRWLVFIGTVLLNTGIFVFAGMDSLATAFIFVGIMVVSFIYYYIRKAMLKNNGIDLHNNLIAAADQEIEDNMYD